MKNEDKLRNIIRNIIKEEISPVSKQETERERAMIDLRVTLEEWLEYIETDLERIPKYQAEANEEFSRVFKTTIQTQEKDEDDNTITFVTKLQPQLILKTCLEYGNKEYMDEGYGDLSSLNDKDIALLADDVLSEVFYFDKNVRISFGLDGNMIEARAEFPLIMNYCDLDYKIRNMYN